MTKIGRALLLVDDNIANRMILRQYLENDFEEILEAENGEIARTMILDRSLPIDLAILDLIMPVMGGIDLLRFLREHNSTVPILVCSASSHLQPAIEAMRLGARDYLEKPFEPELLCARVRTALSEQVLRRENESLRSTIRSRPGPFSLVGSSAAMGKILPVLTKVARSSCTVLVQGETGTGKEMAARAIHHLGPRTNEPFQVIDCGSLSPTLVESELFGHEKGAFTGALTRKAGLFQSAGRGTVFLDEIGELPLAIQARLLRVLQERQIRPVGSTNYAPFEARLVAATNRDLAAEVKTGNFREDLFHRLNVVAVTMPPLRDRREDIPALVEYFLSKLALPDQEVPLVSVETMSALRAYSWPGNIRELENAIERAINLAEGGELVLEDILPSGAEIHDPPSSFGSDQLFSLGEIERQTILRALEASNGNRRVAAELVGIGEATLYRKLKEYGVT
jgi:two-component system response regulator HydG